MDFAQFYNFAFHSFLAMVAACSAIYWVSAVWERTPPSLPLRMVRHPAHFWIAFALAATPFVISLLLDTLLFSSQDVEKFLRIMRSVDLFLPLVDGVFFGFAASCCASQGGGFRLKGAWITALLLILSPPWYFTLGFPAWVYYAAHFIALGIIIAAACMILGRNAPPVAPATGAPPPVPHQPNPLPPLLIGFAPAGLALLSFSLGSAGLFSQMSNDTARILLTLASIGSLGCCITASAMLFRRKTSAAIVGAILLLLLNAFLAFFFGCCALFTGASFH